MNYRPFLLLLFVLKTFSSFAAGTDTVKVFYDVNKYDLASIDKVKINTLLNSMKPTDTIKIIGYADYLGSDQTNLSLSEERAETVFNYLLTLPKNLKVMTEWLGGVPAGTKKRSNDGEPVNRRVDVIRAPWVPNSKKNLLTNKPGIPKPVQAPPKIPEKLVKVAAPVDRRPFRVKVNDLQNVGVGSSLSLQEITFQPGRHILTPEAVPYVDVLLDYLKNHGNIVFEIQGHICCGNDDGDSQDYDTRATGLSINRAKYIYDYFLEKGISANRMSYKGLGSSDPKVWPEMSEYDRYLNRRVEILVVAK